MILVVNLNVSLDKHYEMEKFVPGTVMRASQVDNAPGGKGIHVANVLQAFDEEYLVTGMIGGKTGEFIEAELQKRNMSYDFQRIEGETRSCLAFTTRDGMQTEVLEAGPAVSPEEYAGFIEKYTRLIQQRASLLICSGSVPLGVPDTVYAELIWMAKEHGCRTFLDASGDSLRRGLLAEPCFIKPNKEEFEAICHKRMDSLQDVSREIKRFLRKGISLVAVSLGKNGALLGYGGEIYRVRIPHVETRNPVGSGDAFVAGMAIGLQRKLVPQEAVRLAAACGTANAMEKESGFVKREVVDKLLPQIAIETLV